MSSSLVCRECAEILEHMKQLAEAGQLYEAAQYYDKADSLNAPNITPPPKKKKKNSPALLSDQMLHWV